MHHDLVLLSYGNTLICSGVSGHLFEVTPEKEVVWEYINPVVGKGARNRLEDGSIENNNGIFQVHRYGSDYPDLKGKNLKPTVQIADDLKGGWQPKVNLEGATQSVRSCGNGSGNGASGFISG